MLQLSTYNQQRIQGQLAMLPLRLIDSSMGGEGEILYAPLIKSSVVRHGNDPLPLKYRITPLQTLI